MKILIIIIGIIFSINVFSQDSATPWLGVGIEKGKQGVIIEKVIPGTPAHIANFKALDEITKIDEEMISNPDGLIKAVRSKGIGNKVKITFVRNGKTLVKEVILVGRPDLLDVAKKALINKPAPDFEIDYVVENAKKFKLSDYKGKLILVEFWATWCPACISAIPRLSEFANKFKNKVKVIAISNEPKKVIKKFLSKKMPKLSGEYSSVTYLKTEQGDNDITTKYYSSSIPMFILIDQTGNVIEIDVGAGVVLENIINKAISNLNTTSK